MAVQRLSLADIETAILHALGYSISTSAPWKTSATLYLRINEYGQRLPMRVSEMATALRQQGVKLSYPGIPRFDMWRTMGGNVTMSANGNQIGYLPADYDQYISFYIGSNQVYPTENVRKYHTDLVAANASANSTNLEIGGFVTGANNTWVRQVMAWPTVPANLAPAISVDYWRIPAKMTANNSTDAANQYPDIDPKYESLFIYGPLLDPSVSVTKPQDRDRITQLESALITELAMTARG